MRYTALAADFDGTLAHDGRVEKATMAAMSRLRASGRRLILVTGREVPDLLALLPDMHVFDLVVAENGALLYWPATGEEQQLAAPPPQALITALEHRGVGPMSVGRVVVATWQPHEATVLDVIQELGLEHQVIFNKGAVMILPPSVNKGTGLAAALRELAVSPHNVVAIGDAENDHALFTFAECAVAVANAVPMLKSRADLVTDGDHGAGVVELIDRLVHNDLSDVAEPAMRHAIPLGTLTDGSPLSLPAFGGSVLVAGSSGSGKSTALAGIIERLVAAAYQVCIIDPEGDYDTCGQGIVIGDSSYQPPIGDVMRVLEQPEESVVVGLLGVPLAERPDYFAALTAALVKQRAEAGRPHWTVIDEAHHVLPQWGEHVEPDLFAALGEAILSTVNPDHIAPNVLGGIKVVIAIGAAPDATIRAVCKALGEAVPTFETTELALGEALVWQRGQATAQHVTLVPPRRPHRRHRRKYAQGELASNRSFYFRGPKGAVNLRAASLLQFLDLAADVDDDVWFYHLRRGDIARWFRDVIRDDILVCEATRAEALAGAAIQESQAIVRRAIEEHYTLPE